LDSGNIINEHIEIEPSLERISELIEEDISTAVEALLFASPVPLTVTQLARTLGRNKLLIPSIIDRLNINYDSSGRSFRIERFGDTYRFYTIPEYDKYVSRLADIPRPAKLSRAALEVLSIIAYRQPAVKSEIERIRGIDSDGVMRTLLERGLIAVAGKSDAPGRPLLYRTTEEFLEFFGVAELSQLPKPDIDSEPTQNSKAITLARSPENPRAASPDEAE
jgi:segregation and condensation protein B